MPLKNSFDLPKLFTVSPPLSDFDDEMVWLFSTNSHKIKPIYSDEPVPERYNKKQIRKIISEALKQAVTLNDQKILLDVLEKDPGIIHKLGINTSNISNLIEYNPSLAVNILVILMKSNMSTDYLSAIVRASLNMTLNSLEVVNRLISTIELPPEFLHLYIVNCIRSCEKMTDERFQKRSVRILCVFIQSLLRKKMIDINVLSIELHSFCISFISVKEASELFKLFKTQEAKETVE